MPSTTTFDSPRVTGLLLRETSGRGLPGRRQWVAPGKATRLPTGLRAAQCSVGGHLTTCGARETSAHSDRWSGCHGTHGRSATGSRGAAGVVSAGVAVLVHGRERKDGRRRR